MLTQSLFIISFALAALCQDASSSTSAVAAQTTMNLFIDGQTDERFVASVVKADACETTYALVCTEGDYGTGILATSCDPSVTARATYGPNSFGMYSSISKLGTEVTITESCSLDGTTKAVCSASIGASANGKRTKTHTIVTKTGNDVHFFQVPITAGGDKLSGLASCTASGNAAAPTAFTDVYKVLVVPGAAALLAGAFI